MNAYTENATSRTCTAEAMPNPATAVSTIAAYVSPIGISPGDYLIRYDDDGSLYAVGAGAFPSLYTAIP